MMSRVMTIVGMSMKSSDDEDCDDEESNYNFGTKKEEGAVLLNESEEILHCQDVPRGRGRGLSE